MSLSTPLRRLLLLLALLAPWPALAAPALLVLGDSLSAAFGIDTRSGWVSLLAERLAARGLDLRVVNASISGDTTAGGLARLPPLLAEHRPRVVVIELGGNDGLRGLPLPVVRGNLESLIRASRDAGARVLLLGMRIPPNYGPRYTEAFHTLYADLAQRYEVPLVPFFLDGVAAQPGLMQDDGIHPRAEAQPRLLDNVWPALEPLLRP
ncbi:acyl-CoA thioesterase-1 [Plasticicumulans lactativorans]|uniref:Acyl-CoA thioesterase-1 n=1 Tax=Plasticicumulans lactativorans TaxID=1133106 RepID=A0A4R2LPF7_9GAMM|nr:arylesterase [Plasticicumulans lactativorans]TCO81395.1 acyl-CoA thioesterase-1 [Plasticicumulans lactativorans]